MSVERSSRSDCKPRWSVFVFQPNTGRLSYTIQDNTNSIFVQLINHLFQIGRCPITSFNGKVISRIVAKPNVDPYIERPAKECALTPWNDQMIRVNETVYNDSLSESVLLPGMVSYKIEECHPDEMEKGQLPEYSLIGISSTKMDERSCTCKTRFSDAPALMPSFLR